MGAFTFSGSVVEIEQKVVDKYPREYAALAYLLENGGFPVGRVFATRGSGIEKSMKAEARQWLSSAPVR